MSDPLQIEQNSGEWLEYRLGSVGSSGLASVLAYSKQKGKEDQPLKAREDYMLEKLAESMTGQIKQGYVSRPMEFGTANEALARMSYGERMGVSVRRVGIQPHPTIERAHASPDGYIDEDGAVEIKVPESSTHLRYLHGGVIPDDYLPQCWWVLCCSGRAWLDFVSFDPRQPNERFQLFIKRLHRDESIITHYNEKVSQFWEEVDMLRANLESRYPPILRPDVVAEPDSDADLYLDPADIDRFIPLTAQLRGSMEEEA